MFLLFRVGCRVRRDPGGGRDDAKGGMVGVRASAHPGAVPGTVERILVRQTNDGSQLLAIDLCLDKGQNYRRVTDYRR
jgi:hypothetical protein